MLEIILQSFQKNNNVINVTADKKFIKFKNHIHYALSIQRKFLITHENYTDSFKITMTDNCELFTVFYSYLLLIEKISLIHHTNIFIAQNQHDNV